MTMSMAAAAKPDHHRWLLLADDCAPICYTKWITQLYLLQYNHTCSYFNGARRRSFANKKAEQAQYEQPKIIAMAALHTNLPSQSTRIKRLAITAGDKSQITRLSHEANAGSSQLAELGRQQYFTVRGQEYSWES